MLLQRSSHLWEHVSSNISNTHIWQICFGELCKYELAHYLVCFREATRRSAEVAYWEQAPDSSMDGCSGLWSWNDDGGHPAEKLLANSLSPFSAADI
jgi:hypothetical protein